MTSVSLPDGGALTVYDDAEKGTLDVHSGPFTVAALGLGDEKFDEKAKPPGIISAEVVPTTASSTKPPAKKKKVSKWILWQLWFNTYRCVSIMSAGLISNPASGLGSLGNSLHLWSR
jgi:hypothetical protein